MQPGAWATGRASLRPKVAIRAQGKTSGARSPSIPKRNGKRSARNWNCRDWRIYPSKNDQSAHDEIDARISRWTKPKDRYKVTERLQALGVPAGMVQRSKDLLADPQYTHRGFYRWIEHPEMGEVPYAGHQYTVRGYDNGPRGPAPCLAADSFAVLSEVLGLGDEQIAAAYASGAIN